MNISTTFLNALRHTSSDVEGQRSPEILLGQIYKVSLEDKSFLLPLAGGEFRLSDPFYYEWNPFPSYLLLYTLEGSAVLTTRGSEVVLDHEHLLFLDCSQGFSLRLLQGKWRFQMFFLSGAELSSYYSIFQAAFTCCYPIPIGSCVSQRMQQLTKFSFTPTPAEQIQLHRELTDMFVELMLSALSVSRDVKPIPAYLLSMKADFEENYAENHSLEYFEQTLGISRYRLCREFSATFHTSPLQYLQGKKIEAAKSLLLSTDNPIHEVGAMVGIDNTNHFIHLFKSTPVSHPSSTGRMHRSLYVRHTVLQYQSAFHHGNSGLIIITGDLLDHIMNSSSRHLSHIYFISSNTDITESGIQVIIKSDH